MGSVEVSVLERISGKLGPFVFYTTKTGKHVYREYVRPKDPRTPKQLAHRSKIGLISKTLSPLYRYIKRGHPLRDHNFHRHVGRAYREAIVGEYPNFEIDYSCIQIATGDIQLPEKMLIEVGAADREVILTWDARIADYEKPGSRSDKLYVVCYNSEKPREAIIVQPANRGEGIAKIQVPEGWSLTATHFWAYFTSYDMSRNSESEHFQL